MTEFLYVLVIIFSFVLVSILLINVKNFFFKGEPMKKTCSSAAGESCACDAQGGKIKNCENKLSESV